MGEFDVIGGQAGCWTMCNGRHIDARRMQCCQHPFAERSVRQTTHPAALPTQSRQQTGHIAPCR